MYDNDMSAHHQRDGLKSRSVPNLRVNRLDTWSFFPLNFLCEHK